VADGVVGLDPDLVRALADAMRRAAAAWREAVDDLAAVDSWFQLDSATADARGALADMAGDAELAAADLEARADLAEAIDAGRWDVAFDELVGGLSRAEAAWEAETSGGPDESGAIPWTTSSWDDLESRIVAAAPTVAGRLCDSAAWYREVGAVAGPDGQLYPLLVPTVANASFEDDDEPVWFNADWGRPDDAGVTSLLGADRGWSTVAMETGAGRVGDDLTGVDHALAGLAGAPGARLLAAGGAEPAPLAAYEQMRLDAQWVPAFIPVGPARHRLAADAVDEVSGVAPEIVRTADGHVRVEAAVPGAPAVVLAGAGAQIIQEVATAVENVRTLDDARNIAYAVEYQVNDDGRTRALIRGYQIAVDLHGEPTVAMFYIGAGAQGPGAVALVSPRRNDGYRPTYRTNGIDPP
jgi:hypothetical protein